MSARAATIVIALLGCHACNASEPPPAASPVAASPPPAASRPRERDFDHDHDRVHRCGDAAHAQEPAAADAGSAPISDADKVIAALRPKFRACYNAGLQVDPQMQGCVVTYTFVSASGTVTESRVEAAEGLSEAVVSCIVDAIRNATFTPPGGNGSALRIPVTFIQSEKK